MMNKFEDTQNEIEQDTVSRYQKIKKGVVSGCKKMERGVVSGYKKCEDKFAQTFLKNDDRVTDVATGTEFKQDKGNLARGQRKRRFTLTCSCSLILTTFIGNNRCGDEVRN